MYVDVVINHMCKSIHGEGTPSSCGSKLNGNKEDFPSVPLIWTSMMANVKLAVGTLKTTMIFTRFIFCVLILQ